jgi:hypothetical protein
MVWSQTSHHARHHKSHRAQTRAFEEILSAMEVGPLHASLQSTYLEKDSLGLRNIFCELIIMRYRGGMIDTHGTLHADALWHRMVHVVLEEHAVPQDAIMMQEQSTTCVMQQMARAAPQESKIADAAC